jgi:hypothetical protein
MLVPLCSEVNKKLDRYFNQTGQFLNYFSEDLHRMAF